MYIRNNFNTFTRPLIKLNKKNIVFNNLILSFYLIPNSRNMINMRKVWYSIVQNSGKLIDFFF